MTSGYLLPVPISFPTLFLAFGLLAVVYEDGLWMPLVLLGTIMLGIIPIIWKRNPKEILERAKKILKNFSQIEEDKEAVKFP